MAIMTKESDLLIIIFDISNLQSFGDVARNWLGFANKFVEAKNIALLVHKVDKDAAMPLKNII